MPGSPVFAPSRAAGTAPFAMVHPIPRSGIPPEPDTPRRFDVRSVTGACYTLIEEEGGEDASGACQRRYRTAYAGLPVVANDDGSFTIVDTHTRLVRVGSR